MRRLRVLELRKARQGDATDPAVLTEMEEIHATLAALDMADAPEPSPEATAHVRNRFATELDFLIAQFSSITARQTRTEERVTQVEVKQEVAAVERAQERTDRIAGQQRNYRISAVTLVLLILIIMAALVVFAARAGA